MHLTDFRNARGGRRDYGAGRGAFDFSGKKNSKFLRPFSITEKTVTIFIFAINSSHG
jgi:hypothetical protein